MNTRVKHVAFAMVLASLVVGCSANETDYQGSGKANNAPDSKPIIAATNLALESMAKTIVGDFADVVRPRVELNSERGLDAEEVISMQRAAVVLTNGPGAEDAAWLNLISLNESRIFATTSAEFEFSDFIQVEDYRTVHSHGDEGEHSHPWLVPHCWLNPRLASAQSQGVLNRLIQVFPKQEATFSANHKLLKQELESVQEMVDEVGELIQSRGLTVIASDPRLLFFTRSLNTKDNYFLWFEPPEISTAIVELEKRKSQGTKRLLLLCPESTSLLAEELSNTTDIETATVNLIEEVRTENQHAAEEVGNSRGFVSELRANYQTLKTVVEGMSD